MSSDNDAVKKDLYFPFGKGSLKCNEERCSTKPVLIGIWVPALFEWSRYHGVAKDSVLFIYMCVYEKIKSKVKSIQ